MEAPFFIKKVAVLGAGVMGAQIAAHITNAGIETCLFDLASEGRDPYQLVNTSIQHLKKLKPTPLGTPDTLQRIQPCQYDTDLAVLKTCDLVIEAIGENLDWKESLYARIAPHVGEHTVIVSNTSGLSINALAAVLPEALRARFCGVHFFNPPRYMHLAELIPATQTAPELLNQLETWLTSRLGKGVVRAKDTPNFIANRIGVFSLLATLHHAERLGLGLEQVDALTGVLLGRPKSATFRTMDVVGLDTLAHVVETMTSQLKDDPWHAFFRLPDWLTQLIAAGHLGQKTGQGIYQNRGKAVYDIARADYRPTHVNISDEIKAILSIKNPHEKFEALCASQTPEAALIRACFRDLFHYTAFHLEAIAHCKQDVDAALKWGFGWQQGPFETWQAFGIEAVSEWLSQSIENHETMADVALPAWSDDKASHTARLPVYARQIAPAKKSPVLFENDGVVLSYLEDNIGVLSFKTKSNTISQLVLDGIDASIAIAEQKLDGMIVYQNNPLNFSSGADLAGVAHLVKTNQTEALAAMVHDFQRVLMRLKYSAVPVVAALRGRALGGGCELLMHTDRIVAAFESYPGLVEAGVGLIPAGGGSKELACRAARHAAGKDIMPYLYPYFEQTAMGMVASSAPDAVQRGFLRPEDKVIMHAGEVLFVALSEIKAMQAANYAPPIPERFKVVGREGCAKLKAALANFEAGGFISSHDALIATELAYVMSGGDVDLDTLVDEAWILRLEHAAFMRLAATTPTQARIAHTLTTGKPLRN